MTAEQIEAPYPQAFAIAQKAIELANPTRPGGPDEPAALELMRQVPTEQLLNLASLAVAQRNTDAIDMWPEAEQEKAIFAESFMLSLLSEEDQEKVLKS